MTNWDNLVEGKNLAKVKTIRKKQYIVAKERRSALDELKEEGWELFKEYKDEKWIGVRKEKPYDELFEDKIWVLFAEMGFSNMNSDRNFRMQYDYRNPDITQQIDIFAADDETVLIVECKAAKELKTGVFKKPIEAFYGQMDGLRKQALSRFPGRKVKFIWATSNYIMNNADMEKLKEWNITYFNDATVNYYLELVKHLGSCAKYQLLGNLFANQDIKNMNNRIPAIQGKMGGYTYYSFSIEPEKLLKIGYVLHRSEANKSMMPTYQRLIKKKRLKDIQNFIEEGGYFPNSIIISLDNNGRKLQFDSAPKEFQIEDSISKLGILHLPKKYRSAYIIDGQHRLYGYSDTDYATKNSIPVVAFEDLEREEQVQMFMDINENQKAVPKTLRVMLNADLLWNSSNFNEQRQALCSKMAQMLGEEETSPLLGRVMIGEDEQSDVKCITAAAIQTAFKRTNFFNVYDKQNNILKEGTFDLSDNQKNCDKIYPFIEMCLSFVRENCIDEWNLGKDGLLTINRGMQGVIRVIGDIVDMLSTANILNPKEADITELFDETRFYLEPLCRYMENVPYGVRDELKSYVGAGGDTKFWRSFQKAIADVRKEFSPQGLQEYYRDEAKLFNEESKGLLQESYITIKKVIAYELENLYGKDWLIHGLPISVYKKAQTEAADLTYEKIKNGEDVRDEVSLWECVDLTACADIITHGSHWSEVFEKLFVRPDDIHISGGKKAKTEWMRRMDNINRNLMRPTYSVPKADFDFIRSVNEWLREIES